MMKADLSLNVFWQGTSTTTPLLRVNLSSHFHHCTVHLFGLNVFLGILFLVTK